MLDIFVRGSNGQLFWLLYDGRPNSGFNQGSNTWSWRAMPSLPSGVNFAFDPAAVSWSSNRIDVFVTGSDRRLWHNWWTRPADGVEDPIRGWQQNWEPFPQQLTPGPGLIRSSPAVSSWGENRLDIFVAGIDGLWHTWWDGQQNRWEPLGGYPSEFARPAAVSWSQNRIDVFVLGLDIPLNVEALFHTWYP